MSDGSTVMSGDGNAFTSQTYCGATTEQLTFTITNSIGVGLCCEGVEQCGYYRYEEVTGRFPVFQGRSKCAGAAAAGHSSSS